MAPDKYLNFLRDSVEESAAGTLTEATIKTGLSYAQGGMGLEIWNVVSDMPLPADAPGAGVTDTCTCVLAGASGESAIPSLEDVVTVYKRIMALRAGVATYLPLVFYERGYSRDWNPVKPVLYAYPDVYHYVQSSNASAKLTSKIKVGFLYVDMDSSTYYEVLQAYQQIFG